MDWPLLDWLEISQQLLAQTPSPSPTPAPTPADIELLKNQLEFLKQSYSQFVETVKIIFTILGIAGVIVAYFFGKNFKEFQDSARKDVRDFQDFSRKEIQDATQNYKDFQALARNDIKDIQTAAQREVQTAIHQVRQDAEKQIPQFVEVEVNRIVKEQITILKRTLGREQVIGSTLVDYYLPDGTAQPTEFTLLQARHFKTVRFRTTLQSIARSPGDVIVLDLKNWIMPSGQRFRDLPEAEQQQPGKQLVHDLLDVLSDTIVIVVYIRGRLFYLNDIDDRYVIAANNPVTLVGNVADGAYVAASDRTP